MSVKITLPVHFAPPAFLRLLSPIKFLKQMCNKTLDNDFYQSHFVMYFFKSLSQDLALYKSGPSSHLHLEPHKVHRFSASLTNFQEQVGWGN